MALTIKEIENAKPKAKKYKMTVHATARRVEHFKVGATMIQGPDFVTSSHSLPSQRS